jgi:glycosyltransferase involved in cell wall biosynthesis
VRALVVSNMRPDAAHPERGQFVRDQVAALRGLAGEDLEVELYEFPPGARELARAGGELRRRYAGRGRRRPGANGGFDVVHAHFGLTAWPALAVPARVRALTVHGMDVNHPRTRLATRLALGRIDLLAAVSVELAAQLPDRARRRAVILPCGVDLERFHPASRGQARAELGLDAERRYLLFPHDPTRPDKRHDRAVALARAVGAELLTLGGIEPARVATWIAAADAVVVPSEREGFGLAVLEALACEVPVLATPVGNHSEALRDLPGTLCAPFEVEVWGSFLMTRLGDREAGAGATPAPAQGRSDTRLGPSARERAARFSAPAMAEHVASAWRAALHASG